MAKDKSHKIDIAQQKTRLGIDKARLAKLQRDTPSDAGSFKEHFRHAPPPTKDERDEMIETYKSQMEQFLRRAWPQYDAERRELEREAQRDWLLQFTHLYP